MRFVRLVLLALVLVTVTIRYPTDLHSSGLSPWWLFLPALLAGLRATPGRAAGIGWGFGLLADLFSLEPLGVHAFLFAAAALLLARVRAHFFSDHTVTLGVMAFGFSFLVSLALLFRIEAAAPEFRLVGHLSSAFLLSLVTALAFPLVVLLDRRLDLLRGFREKAPDVRA